MESYSPFFQTLHDERSPTGHLGTGTHVSILRAIVFHGPTLVPLTTGAPVDFAVIWDEDHDTRVIKAIEAIYRAGFLGSILMIGERKGSLNAIVSAHVQEPKLLSSLEGKLRAVAQRIEGDPWSSSLRTLDGPRHEIIDDRHDRVSLYLENLQMLWRLGVKVSARDRKTGVEHLTEEQILTIVKCVSGDSKKAEQTRILLMSTLARQLEAEKEHKPETTKDHYDKVVRKLHSLFPDLTTEQILTVIRCVPGDSKEAHESRAILLRNLKSQIKAEKEGTQFSMTVWTGIKADLIERAAIAATEDIEAKATGDHRTKPATSLRLVES